MYTPNRTLEELKHIILWLPIYWQYISQSHLRGIETNAYYWGVVVENVLPIAP